MNHGIRTRLRRALLTLGTTIATLALLPAAASAATADLSMTIDDNPDPVQVGAALNYTLTIANLGPETATDVTVFNQLDPGVEFVSATPSTGTCDRNGRTVACALGTMGFDPYFPAAVEETVTIRVIPRQVGQLTDVASALSADTDPDSVNSADSETTTVTAGGGGGGGGATSCGGATATILGTNGNDTLVGTKGADVIAALGGKDLIRGLGGNDRICGGDGNDIGKGGAGNDVIKGTSGKDKLSGGAGDDGLSGGPGRDRLSGGPGVDRLLGGGGRDKCRGGGGDDTDRSC